MAVLDVHQDAVVIRVVYDGPPQAGKTTSVHALARGLGGRVEAPEEISGRTLYFDWLDYTGGLFEGRRIRCQVISVPGQATLASRRRRLLETADVVVFVGDSGMEDQSATKSYLEGLRTVLARVDGPPIGIVLQANKRDRPGAVPLPAIRAILDGIGGRIALVESVATDGAGVREAFVFAVRLALDRVRELMRLDQLPVQRPSIDNAQDLLAQLQTEEGATLDLAADSGLKHTPMHELREPSMAAAALHEIVQENVAVVPANSVWDDHHTRAESDADQSAPSDATPLLPGGNLPSGMIWPPVNGRLILHAAASGTITLKRQPNGDWVGSTETDWHLHSPANARFATLDAGRESLVNWARMHAASAHVISSERCVVLSADDAGHYRLWQIVRLGHSLRDEFDAAVRGGPAMIARGLLMLTRAFLLAAERFAGAACWLPLNLRHVGAFAGGACFLGHMPDPKNARPPVARTQAAALKLLSMQLEYAHPDVDGGRQEALSELEQLIGSEASSPIDVTHGFARRYLADIRS